MAVQLGDIVAIESGMKYVVLGFIGNAQGGRDARLIRKTEANRYAGFLKDARGLIITESPSFEIGERVMVDGLPGGYLGTEDGVARVLLAERRKQTKAGDYIALDAAMARVGIGLLVLENRLL